MPPSRPICTRAEWLALKARARSHCPAPEGYSLIFRRGPCKDHGECDLRGMRFYITIREAATETETQDALVHELAHMLSWPLGENVHNTDHGPQWGVCYSQAYRAIRGER